jgi:hypothetical protein
VLLVKADNLVQVDSYSDQKAEAGASACSDFASLNRKKTANRISSRPAPVPHAWGSEQLQPGLLYS